MTKIAFQVSTRAEALATPGLLPDGFIFLEIAPKVLPVGRLPKAVVSTELVRDWVLRVSYCWGLAYGLLWTYNHILVN